MKDYVVTPVGTFREVHTKGELTDRWMFCCPDCAVWRYLSEDQWHGREALEPHVARPCTYDETHDFATILGALIGHEP